MLKTADNAQISQVGPGTPMGTYLRKFWMPVARSAAVRPGADPVRAKALGVPMVIYRLADGSLGCLDEQCPHRRASLALGFNSGSSLTCIYHGWEFGSGGRCLAVPTEPEQRRDRFRQILPVNAHPVREAAGMIWVYLGDGDEPPFPDMDFMGLDEGQCQAVVGVTRCGWIQCLEGLVDTAHLGQLHKTQFPGQHQVAYEAAPSIIVRDRPYGMRIYADRPRPDGGHYYRVTEYIAPFWCFVPQNDERAAFCIVPIDDTHCLQWVVWYDKNDRLDPAKPLGRHVAPLTLHPDDFTAGMRGKQRWGQDRDTLGRDHFSGLDNLFFEDLAVQESQGAIMDRENEHLGSSDVGVVRLRKILRDAATRAVAEVPVIFNRPGENDLKSVRGAAFESEGDDAEEALAVAGGGV
ncbi:Rieske 2Fe-2S domain-containing protein [Nocardia jiangxiensis]|uniref:Rieske 2Fe-2S domain-containing protein n=1 Tax=Nocardia jiangxiensis TaxID=282685 RepID=A0ABW6RV58_9NOCA|nr:Rieske 2Fe-2S domain-containing protein [Nocardia jiangxiensis]